MSTVREQFLTYCGDTKRNCIPTVKLNGLFSLKISEERVKAGDAQKYAKIQLQISLLVKLVVGPLRAAKQKTDEQ